MILKRQKLFSWWSNLNKKALVHNAKMGIMWNPSWSKYISKEEYDSYNPYKNNKRKEETLTIDDLINKFPHLKNDFLKLQKLDKDESIKKYHPSFGDGDEYPCFYIDYNLKSNYNDNFIPVISWHFQYETLGINPKIGYWVEEDHPNKRINIKQYLLKEYKNQLDDYIDSKKNDSYGWDPEEYDEVIEWIKVLIKGVQKYL